MAPPGTKYIMKAVGLGKAHKEIEERKRQLTEDDQRRHMPSRGGKIGPQNLEPSAGTGYETFGGKIWYPGQSGAVQLPSIKNPRVHRNDVILENLVVPWHWDPNDRNYIILERRMTEHEMSKLLEQMREWRMPKDLERRNQNLHDYTSMERPYQHQGQNDGTRSQSTTAHGPAEATSHDYTSMERPYQHQGQNDGTRPQSRTPRGPAEATFLSPRPRPAQETMLRPPTARPGSRPYEGAPSARSASRQRGHTLDHIGFAPPSESGNLAREQRLEQAAMNARRSSAQYTRGFGQPQRERGLYSAQEPELQRAYSHAPGPMSMDAAGTGRHRGGRSQSRDL